MGTEYEEVINVRLNSSMLRELDRVVADEGKTRAEGIREALAVYIGARKNAGQPATTEPGL